MLFCVVCNTNLFATHMIGGDVYYRCLGGNRFELTFVLYQDCLNGEPQAIDADKPLKFAIYTNQVNPVFVVSRSDLYPVSTEYVPPNFSNECVNNPPKTCMQRQEFRTEITLPPNNVGYKIVYQRCCRNASIMNIMNPGNTGVTYSTIIPPFFNGQCINNSARFKNVPPQIICIDNPFVYDFSATDVDGDSLTYRLCEAYIGASPSDPAPVDNDIAPVNPPVQYKPPYSYAMPMTGMPPLTINSQTGIITAMPNQTGRFVVTICADEWREGVIINTISRDLQFVVTDCSKAVVAQIPELIDYPNTYTINCKDYTVKFQNHSYGGFRYDWDFGIANATSTEFEPTFTYPDTGTYVVKLVVNAGSTCPDSIERIVKIYPTFNTEFNWNGILCPETPIEFTDLSTATYGEVNDWQWSFGDGNVSNEQNPVHIYDKPGGLKTVTLISKSNYGCSDTLSKEINLAYFNPFAGNDTMIVLGYPFSLNGSGTQYYRWEPSDYLSNPNIANPSINFPDTGIYTYVLHGSTDEGCASTDTIVIQVVLYSHIFVPNAFSPNGDGLNDVFTPKIVGYSNINNFQVFNRFGELVYSSANNNSPSWDGLLRGKPSDVGVYFWRIECTNVLTNEKEVKTGDVTLLR